MAKERVEEYLVFKKWNFKVENEELIVEQCPVCIDSKFRFSIHSTMGVYQCFKCAERGNLFTLKKAMGDLQALKTQTEEVWGEDIHYDLIPLEDVEKLHQQLLTDEYAKSWVYGRGLADDAIKAFRLGLDIRPNGRHLVFPYYRGGQCINLKYRTLPPLEKGFTWKPKCEKPLYNIDVIDNKDIKDVIVFEGEIDLITATMMGYPNACGLPNGVDTFDHTHWDALIKKDKIWLVLDPDVAGRKGVKTIANRLGADRCFDVRIPNGMDPNDLLMKYGYVEGKKRLDACITDAKSFGASSVVSLYSALDELKAHILTGGQVESGYASPWASVNRVLGPIGCGEVILVLAIPKTGKTTFCLQWLYWLAERHEVPSLMFCLEMPLWRLSQSLVSHVNLSPRDKLSTIDVEITHLKTKGKPLFFGEKPKEWNFEKVRDVIGYAVQRHGVKVVCFDNFHLLCREVENSNQEQAKMSAQFKQMASEFDIAILLVVQPRKLDPNHVPSFYDASGTGALIADSDGMLTMWRKPLMTADSGEEDNVETAALDPRTVISVPASRYRPGGRISLWCAGDVATFTEMGNEPLIPVVVQ